jgi:hypothetical protein
MGYRCEVGAMTDFPFDLWTRLIAEHFFNPSRAGQSVRLNVTRELLNTLGKAHGFSSNDFTRHAALGLSAIRKESDNVCDYAEALFDRWRVGHETLGGSADDFPPFIGYLAVFVYVGTLQAEAEPSYHRQLWSLFPIQSRSATPSMYPGFDRMIHLWEALENWSWRTRGGQHGVFRLLRLGAFAHVSIPWAQGIMTEEERERLPGVFAASELTPQSPAPPARLKQIVSDFGGGVLSARTIRAFKTGDDLEAYVLDDLRRELRAWDGTCQAQSPALKQPTAVPPRSADLILFLQRRGAVLIPRLRFESILDDRVPAAKYQARDGQPTLTAAPAPGWSDVVKAEDGSDFDASKLVWDRDYTWSGSPASGPRRLKFSGRSIRVFVQASECGKGGLVEGDYLPTSRCCWVAGGSYELAFVEGWLGRLPAGAYRLESANLPQNWRMFRIERVPTDPDIRAAFPGGAEDAEPELWLRGGLRVRMGRGKQYHTFAPPRVELAGDRSGVSVVVGDVPLVDVDRDESDGVYEIPLSVGAGAVRVRAVRDGLTVAEESFTLMDVAHAGNPTRVWGFLDGFGNVTNATTRWCGAWVDAPGGPRFDFRSVDSPRAVADIKSGAGPVTVSGATPSFEADPSRESPPWISAAVIDPPSGCSSELPETHSPRPEKVSPPTIGLNTVASAMNALALQQSVIEQVSLIEKLVARIEGDLARLAALIPGNDEELVSLVCDILAKSATARTDVSRVCEAANLRPEWADLPALMSLLEEARTELEAKLNSEVVEPFRRLAEYLEAGQVGHHLPKMREKLNALRRDAANELRTAAIPNDRPLPGPTDRQGWLDWFWSTGDATEQVVDDIRGLLPFLAAFLELVTREQWKPASLEPALPVIPADTAVREHDPLTGLSEEIAPLNAVQVPFTDEPTGIAELVPPLEEPSVESVPDQGLAPAATEDDEQSSLATTELLAVDAEAATMSDFGSLAAGTPPDSKRGPHYAETAGTSDNGAHVPPAALPLDLASFDEFQKSNWITPQGTCEPAPWLDRAAFGDSVTDALFRALEAEQFGRAKVFAAAAQQVGLEGTPTRDEVETWARLWLKPRDAVGLGIDGVLQLRLAAGEGRLNSAPVWKFRLCLEAIRPSRDLPLAHGEEDEWVDATGFHSGAMRQMLLLLLRAGRATDRPTDDIRRALKTGPRLDSLAEELAEARKEFHAEVRRLWSGAGGKIERNHCRRAWDEFISQVRPTVGLLYPPNEGGEEEWDADDVGRKIARLEKVHKDIADDVKAKFHDRHKMDRAARSIAEMSSRINDLYRKVRAAKEGERARPVSDEEMVTRAKSLLAESPLSDQFEEVCRQLIVRHLEVRVGADPKTGLTAADLLAYPALLGCIATEPGLLSGNDDTEVVPFVNVVLPTAAAAILLNQSQADIRAANGEHLVDRLASVLLPHQRYDVLAPLASHLTPSGQAKIRAAREAVASETAEALAQVKRGWERLADMASRGEKVFKDVLREATGHMKAVSRNESSRPGEELMFKEWLTRLARHMDEVFADELATLRRAVSHAAHPAKESILRALDEGRFTDAVYLRNESPRDQANPLTARRQTAWRKQATTRFTDAARELREHRQRLDPTGREKVESVELIDTWLSGHTGSLPSDRPLRTRFADVVFADTFGQEGEQLRKQGKSEPSFFRMPCQKVREYLDRQGLNPSFLPQLARAEEIILITPPTRYADPGLVQQTANLIAANHANKLVGVLAPGITGDLRAALLHELRQRKVMAAVVDSTDLCRLFNPGGRQINLVVGLLEVMLEQQRWATISPFHAHDGAQARIEMYVGRAQEAAVLATDNKYSRLFSGRKLGKSALLKFIQDRYDGACLPSGNTLRVLRIPIVGVKSDAIVISKVLSELKTRLGFQPAAPAECTTDTFLTQLAEYLARDPRVSLLVILDEADVFIERQLQDFDDHKEQCLSFRIRSDAQKDVDNQGLPRIRFVFAGYRKANTRGGAWGNWGDPLLLNPLEADEAADLIAGSLARLGIDAADVAPAIAYRCGYQPAVLLRFGERLLDLLGDCYPDGGDRGHVEVTPAHVREVFDQQAVQDEIRTVVRHNFHGNDAGQAVFSATLLAFAALAPGDALVNAPEEIWRKLRELVDRGGVSIEQIAGRFGWLSPRAPDRPDPTEVGLSEVNRHLADFHERKLLTLVSREGGVYRLRFPYHLSILLVDVENEAWSALAHLARVADVVGEDDMSGDPVNPFALDDLLMVVRRYKDLGLEGYRAGLLGTLWPHSVNNADWLANRFGYDPGQLSQRGDGRPATAGAYLEISPAEAKTVLASRAAEAPPALMVGGADLLRWGLQQARAGQAIEVQGQRRLTRQAVNRWFLRVREFTFDGDGLDRIVRLTGRIPFLLNVFDHILQMVLSTDGGVHVGADDFDKAVAKYDKKVAEQLERLISGPETTQLATRERELLLMIVVAGWATGFKQSSLVKDLGEYWDERLFEPAWEKLCPRRPYPPGYADGGDDRLAARVVADLGLLPHPIDQTGSPGEAYIDRDDPLVRIIAPALARGGVHA